MKHVKIILIMSLLMIAMASPAYAAPHYGWPPSENRPSLQVQKWISADEILIGETITINVNITNWSTQFAYNLTIEEPAFNDFTVKRIEGYDEYIYTAFGPGASVSYSYTIQPTNKGNYTIEPTEITFFDENSTKMFAESSFIPFNVAQEISTVSQEDQWQTLLIMSSIIFLIPTLALIVNSMLRRR